MTAWKCWLALVALSAIVGLASAAEQTQDDSALQGEDEREGKFFPYIVRRTTTAFSIVRQTSTVPFTCISTIESMTACMGRRRRRRKRTAALKPDAESLPSPSELAADALSSSIGDASDAKAVSEREERLIITSWSTSMTTVTSVSFVTTFDVTVTLSVACTLGGANFADVC